MWGGDAVIEIENFVRGGKPEKRNQGEISYRCAFDSSPNFQKHFKAPSSEFSRFVAFFSNGQVDFAGEEPEDAIYFERAGSPWGMNDGGNRRVMKWKMETSATIQPMGGRGVAFGDLLLHVFARGTSVADYDYHPPCEEDPSGHWSKQEKEYVDQLCWLTSRSPRTGRSPFGTSAPYCNIRGSPRAF